MAHKLKLGNGLISWRNVTVFLLCIGLPALSQAATTVTVSVTVQEKPACIINDNRTIEVDFGEILTVSVDGSNYMKKIDYTLVCSGLKSNALQMRIQGNPAVFNTSALQTNISDFGVALLNDGQPLRINSWLKFTYPNMPQLQAVPVKRSGSKLPGGAFTAGATLLIAYQ